MILHVAVLLSLCSPAFTYVAPAQEIKLEVLENWVTEDTVEVRVCLDPESKLDHLTRFDLIANGLGRSWRLQRLPQKMDRRLCYGGVSLEKEDLAEVTTLRITEEGGDKHLQEMETFFIVPDVTHVSKDVYQICWENPKKVTFLVNEKKLLHSCIHCCHTARAQGMSHLVTIESGTEGFKHVVQLKLPVKHNSDLRMTILTIKEIHKVMRDDDPTGQNQNIEIVLEDHGPIDADDYELILNVDGLQIRYDCYELPDSTATKIEFNGTFVDSKSVIVVATKYGNETVAIGQIDEVIKDPGSRAAWVGDAAARSLRVDPGNSVTVDVPGRESCSGGTCYYIGLRYDPLEPPVMCKTIYNVVFCDDVVPDVTNSVEMPSLDLHNLKELIVALDPSSQPTEVVVSASGAIVSPNDFSCSDAGSGTCSQQVEIADGVDNINVLIVTLSDEGLVNQSISTDFEVYKVNVDQLTFDVFRVTLDPSSSPGNYTMQLQRKADVECEDKAVVKGGRCQAFFSRVTEASDVTVSRTGEPKTVTYSVAPKEPPARSYIRSITSLNGNFGDRIQVVSSNAISRVDFVTFVQDVASGAEEMIPTKEGSDYSVDVPTHGAGRWDFVVLGYGEEGTLLEVGQAYVELEKMDASVAVVWEEDSSASFRLDVGSLQEVVMEDVGSCKRWESPCYFLQVETEAASRAHCVLLLNSIEVATKSLTTLLQCDDSFTPFHELSGDISLSLDDSEKMIVIGKFPGDSTEITIFDSVAPSVILSYNASSCEESDGSSEQQCTQRFKSPAQRRTLDVLVVTLGKEGDVQGSALVTYTYGAEGHSTWVIIVTVLASVLVLAFVACGVSVVVKVFHWIKKKKAKKSIRENTSGLDISGPRPWESSPADNSYDKTTG